MLGKVSVRYGRRTSHQGRVAGGLLRITVRLALVVLFLRLVVFKDKLGPSARCRRKELALGLRRDEVVFEVKDRQGRRPCNDLLQVFCAPVVYVALLKV